MTAKITPALFLLPLIIYGALSLYQLNLPGLHYDEAFEAVPALQLLQNQPVTTFRDHGLKIGNYTLPLMTQDYIGAINTYLSIPFIAILGPTPAALRLMTIALGGLTLWLAYAFSAQLTRNRLAGLATALLLMADPTFVFWNRQGIFVTSVTATIGVAAALCWLFYFRQKSTHWAVAGAFLLGFGLYAKFLFLWLILAFIGALILLNLSKLRSPKKLLPPLKDIVFMIIAFLLGCFPLIIYNLQTNGTYLNITDNAQTSYYGVNNLAVGTNLIERLAQFGVMLNGSQFWYLGSIQGSIPLPSSIFVLVLISVVILTTRKTFSHSTIQLKVAFFPLLVIGLTILLSIGTVSALWVTHFALLMPWPAIALATLGWLLLSGPVILSKNKTAIVVGVVLVVLIANHLFNTTRYHISLTESGGLSTHSDAIYNLSDWLAQNANGPVAAMDWGLAAPVTYLTANRVAPIEVFGYAWESNETLDARLQELIAQPATLYLWRAPDEVIFDRSSEFKALYQPLNLEENIEAAFYERSGRPLLGVTQLVESGNAENAPK